MWCGDGAVGRRWCEEKHKGPWLGPEGQMSEKIGEMRLVFRLGYIPGQEIS